jgi:multidrug efflux system membrane fusion protein
LLKPRRSLLLINRASVRCTKALCVDRRAEVIVGIRSRIIVVALSALAVGGAAGGYLLQSSEPVRAARPQAAAAVPVSIAVASRRDVPIYLAGLGTVQASYTIGIHAQVDGKLLEVGFTEGQHVKAGDVLAKIDPRLYQAALDQAKAKKGQDEAQLVSAQKDLARSKTLAAQNFQTEQIVDQQEAKVAQLKAAIAADSAAIDTAQTQLDYTTITAPSEGRIGVRLVDPGNLVRASDQGSIATLTRLQPISVLFTLPSRALDDVRDAMARGPVEVTAFDRDNARALGTGTLLLVDNLIDQATATIRLKAIFENKDERLWPGEFVNARLLLESRKDALTVPSSAVQRGPQGLLAWVVDDGNVARAVPIQVGPTTGDLTIVTSGLADGARVVTDGYYKLQQNARVTITASQPGRAGGTS